MTNKKILFISHSASLTGAPLLLLDIATHLKRLATDCSFILGDDGKIKNRFSALGPTYVEPLYPDEIKYWREIKRVAGRLSILKKLKPDLVYCNTVHTAKWLVYARMLGIPTLMHIHELSMGFETLNGMENWMVKKLPDKYIAVSESVKNYLVNKRGVDAEKIEVIHAGINIANFKSTPDTVQLKNSLGLQNAFVIGTVGRICFMKGSDIFLRLASGLKNSVQNGIKLKFLIVCTVEDTKFYADFKRDLSSFGLESDFIFIEDAENASVYYSAMDIFVSTAREDPFPLVVLEAMAAKKPVIAFEVGGIPEAVNEECGIIINGLDVETMKYKIIELISRPDKIGEMGDAALLRVSKEFALSHNIMKFNKVIDALLSKK